MLTHDESARIFAEALTAARKAVAVPIVPAPCSWREGCDALAPFAGAYCPEHHEAARGYHGPADPVEVETRRTRTAAEPTPADPALVALLAEARAYLDAYTGTHPLLLDLRADRRYGTAYFRMTEGRATAILRVRDAEAAAAAKAAADPDMPRYAEAIAWIEAHAERNDFAASLRDAVRRWGRLTVKQYDAVIRNVERDAPPAGAPEGTPPAAPATEGWYMVDGQAFKVQKAVHGSGNLYAKRLVVTGHGEATWEYAPGMVRRLTEADRMTAEAAAAMGRLYGVCMVCGRTLTDEGSIEAGIGPVCRGRLG